MLDLVRAKIGARPPKWENERNDRSKRRNLGNDDSPRAKNFDSLATSASGSTSHAPSSSEPFHRVTVCVLAHVSAADIEFPTPERTLAPAA
jgi:hypothetical protein